MQPKDGEYFFAFSIEQFNEGREKLIQMGAIKEGDKLYGDAELSMYGTRKGFDDFYAFYRDVQRKIAAECDPQDVYDCEYRNHECCITNDDSDAYSVVVGLFGSTVAQNVNRRKPF